MSWQDWVLAASQLVFVAALIPSYRRREYPALTSCLLTGGTLTVMSATFLTLQLWWSSGTTLLCAFMWFGMAEQQWLQVLRKAGDSTDPSAGNGGNRSSRVRGNE